MHLHFPHLHFLHLLELEGTVCFKALADLINCCCCYCLYEVSFIDSDCRSRAKMQQTCSSSEGQMPQLSPLPRLLNHRFLHSQPRCASLSVDSRRDSQHLPVHIVSVFHIHCTYLILACLIKGLFCFEVLSFLTYKTQLTVTIPLLQADSLHSQFT